MIIRKEETKDETEIAQVVQAAFANHPYGNHNEHLLVNALRKANALTLSLVVEENGEIIGHIAFSPVSISGHPNANWYGLAPVAVRPDKQNLGIGKMLILKGLEILKENHAEGCVLVGEPAYYNQFGFFQKDRLTYEGITPEYFLVFPFGDNIPEGKVSYHPEFLKI